MFGSMESVVAVEQAQIAPTANEEDIVPEGPGGAVRVSVIMAVYNGSQYLRQALESVLQQECEGLEFVIVDDCSTDDTGAIIQSYADPRIVYVRNERNLGQTESLNKGLACAKGELIARIDADDLFGIGKLQRQVEFLDEHAGVAVCGTWAVRIDSEGRNLGLFTAPVAPLDVRFRMLWAVPVGHVTVVMRRNALVEAGGYDVRYRFAADFALWSTLVKRGAIITNIPEPLAFIREGLLTFGAAQKVGPAGDESAEIIQQNARDLAQIELTLQECRDIGLLFSSAAGLTPKAIQTAYANLHRMARRVYGAPPVRVWLELFAILFWSVAKGVACRRGHRPALSLLREAWSLFTALWSRPAAFAVAVGALVTAALAQQRMVRLKVLLAPLIARLSGRTGGN